MASEVCWKQPPRLAGPPERHLVACHHPAFDVDAAAVPGQRPALAAPHVASEGMAG
jgi:hypothetical protein